MPPIPEVPHETEHPLYNHCPMKTLVTGAAGFIGSAVVRTLLARGRQVRCYVEPGATSVNLRGLEVEVVEGDINDRARVSAALAGCDVLYHLAGLYRLWLPDYSVLYKVNVEGTKTVLFAALKAGLRRVVYTSSIAAVGVSRTGELADETTRFNTWPDANHYVRSKYLSELDALRFAKEGVPIVIVNPAFPFGERDIGPTPTGRVIIDTLRERVPGYVDGGLNVIDVDDVAEGHVLAEERGRVGERYILGSHNLTYKELYEVITELGGVRPVRRRLSARMIHGIGWAMERYATITQRPPPITYKGARYATKQLWYDTTKARVELGVPRTELRETVEKSIRWFRGHGYA